MGGGTHYLNNGMLPVPNATASYWRSDPHWIDEYRSTASLPATCDILIIGAGMSGVSTAYHLLNSEWPSEQQPSIVLLEARQACSGATGRNGGHVRFGPSKIRGRIAADGFDATAAITEFVLKTIHAIKRVIEKEGISAESELHRTFDVLMDDGEADEAETLFRMLLERGFPGVEDIDYVPLEFAERVTSVKGAEAALSAPVLSLWPYKFVTQLLASVVKRGVNLQTNTPVLSIHTTDFPSHDTKSKSSHYSTTAFTPRGSIRARKVVFATNAYSAGLLPQYRGTLVPVKAQAAHISVPAVAGGSRSAPYLSNTYNIGYGKGHDDYLNPRPDGGIVLGGGKWIYQADRADWHDTVDDSKLIRALGGYYETYMQDHFIGFADSGARMDYAWTGIVTESIDSLPHIGRVPGQQNQFLIGGFNGGGMSLIFLSAMGIAKMLREDCEFESTDIPWLFKTTENRLMKAQGREESGEVENGKSDLASPLSSSSRGSDYDSFVFRTCEGY